MKKKLRVGGVLLLAMVLTLTMSIGSVFAQDSYEPINGNNAKIPIPVKKTLDIGNAEAYPQHTVTFKVGTGTAYNRSGTVTATGTVPDLEYTFTGAKTDLEFTGEFDFSRVKFPKPGLYKFPVTEQISNNLITPVSGSETTYYVYVQVDNIVETTGASGLEYAPTAYKIVKGSSVQAPTGNPSSTAKVTTALFENQYLNSKLNVKKEVTGNQGDKTREFTVTVQVGGVASNLQYTVKHVSGKPKVNGSEVKAGNPVIVNTGSIELKLKDTDEVEISGIPKNAGVSVAETDANQSDYTTTSSVDGASATSAGSWAHTFNPTATNSDDHRVVFINDKQGAIPTGIFINYWPYMLVVLVALAAAITFVRIRRNRYQEDDI